MNLEARREPATIFCMSPPTHNRYPYSPIPARAIYDWPDGKRLAVYIGLNLEWFSFGQGLGAELAPGGPQPDVLNYAWRDYGNRVGVFRLAELFGELQLPVSLLINSEMYRHAPETVAAFADAELVGHGRTNSERQGELSEYDERLLIEETTAAIERHSGKRPRGWLGPWISQSPLTPDLLQEAGYRYLLDWCHGGEIDLMTLLRAMSTRPAELLGLPGGTLRSGAPADVIVVDVELPWVLDPNELKSKCKNTPFDEARLTGRVVRTIVSGRTVYEYV